MLADLHCHSRHSDGSLAVPELVQRAVSNSVELLALTDHDNINGSIEAHAYIAEHKLPLKYVHGVEISCQWHAFEIHIVGLNFDPADTALVNLLQQQQQARTERFDKILGKLAQRGVLLHRHECQFSGMPTRKHIADALLNKGYVEHPQQAFDRFIGKGQSAFVKAKWCSIAEAIAAIQQAGGVAVLAHPHAYKLSNKWLRKLCCEAKQWGLDGLEVSISQQPMGQRSALAEFADDYQLKASQGSDFHHPHGWRDLGKNLCLPDQCVPIWNDWSIS
ncbi:PHP domain-containing protein [Idiomarina seosinensis]|uniref:PHP domain-containing protein n=1 Tax=Idiomarina seosinensis TaxID=281739 RepID=UPI00384CEA1D